VGCPRAETSYNVGTTSQLGVAYRGRALQGQGGGERDLPTPFLIIDKSQVLAGPGSAICSSVGLNKPRGFRYLPLPIFRRRTVPRSREAVWTVTKADPTISRGGVVPRCPMLYCQVFVPSE
jgi:hypothetical protein